MHTMSVECCIWQALYQLASIFCEYLHSYIYASEQMANAAMLIRILCKAVTCETCPNDISFAAHFVDTQPKPLCPGRDPLNSCSCTPAIWSTCWPQQACGFIPQLDCIPCLGLHSFVWDCIPLFGTAGCQRAEAQAQGMELTTSGSRNRPNLFCSTAVEAEG